MKTMRLVALALCVALSSCATVIRGTSTTFTVRSIPEGAQVKLSTGETCPATPCSFKRPRKEQFTVTVSKDGFETVETNIRSYWSKNGTVTGVVGNAIIGGGIGIGVDAATGANRDLEPNPLVVTLKAVVIAPAVVEAPVAAPEAAPAAPEPAAPTPTPAPVPAPASASSPTPG